MDETPHKSPERFQFTLRTLFLVVTGCAFLLASFRAHWLIGLWASLVYSIVGLILVGESPYFGNSKPPPKNALKPSTAWVIVILFFLAVMFLFMGSGAFRLPIFRQ